jgi:hypothetical protein
VLYSHSELLSTTSVLVLHWFSETTTGCHDDDVGLLRLSQPFPFLSFRSSHPKTGSVLARRVQPAFANIRHRRALLPSLVVLLPRRHILMLDEVSTGLWWLYMTATHDRHVLYRCPLVRNMQGRAAPRVAEVCFGRINATSTTRSPNHARQVEVHHKMQGAEVVWEVMARVGWMQHVAKQRASLIAVQNIRDHAHARV